MDDEPLDDDEDAEERMDAADDDLNGDAHDQK